MPVTHSHSLAHTHSDAINTHFGAGLDSEMAFSWKLQGGSGRFICIK